MEMNDGQKKLLLEISVLCDPAFVVENGREKVVMIPFSGTASGPYFSGKVIGPAADTQKTEQGGGVRLSARYMLEGRDAEGNGCRIFVENQGNDDEGFVPWIVSDSPVLNRMNLSGLSAVSEGTPDGVTVRIFSN